MEICNETFGLIVTNDVFRLIILVGLTGARPFSRSAMHPEDTTNMGADATACIKGARYTCVEEILRCETSSIMNITY